MTGNSDPSSHGPRLVSKWSHTFRVISGCKGGDMAEGADMPLETVITADIVEVAVEEPGGREEGRGSPDAQTGG